MADLIDRQAALDAIDSWRRDYPLELQEPIDDCWNSVRELPAAQPDHNADVSEKVEEGDCISRRAAIDALHTWFRDGFDEDKWWNSTHVLAAIEGIPSVQPATNCSEIPNGSDDTISRQAAIDAMGKAKWAKERLEQLPPAQPERKKGEWIKISPANIYECSECGKNVMTGDISEYDFCHGCGADMRGMEDG